MPAGSAQPSASVAGSMQPPPGLTPQQDDGNVNDWWQHDWHWQDPAQWQAAQGYRRRSKREQWEREHGGRKKKRGGFHADWYDWYYNPKNW